MILYIYILVRPFAQCCTRRSIIPFNAYGALMGEIPRMKRARVRYSAYTFFFTVMFCGKIYAIRARVHLEREEKFIRSVVFFFLLRGVTRGIARRLLFLSDAQCISDGISCRSAIEYCLFVRGWHVTMPISHATAPCRRYLFNLRVLLFARAPIFVAGRSIYFGHGHFPHF